MQAFPLLAQFQAQTLQTNIMADINRNRDPERHTSTEKTSESEGGSEVLQEDITSGAYAKQELIDPTKADDQNWLTTVIRRRFAAITTVFRALCKDASQNS